MMQSRFDMTRLCFTTSPTATSDPIVGGVSADLTLRQMVTSDSLLAPGVQPGGTMHASGRSGGKSTLDQIDENRVSGEEWERKMSECSGMFF